MCVSTDLNTEIIYRILYSPNTGSLKPIIDGSNLVVI